ncbi:MAG: T9SS type A sorting domain-containing protein [Tannerellaceae bacterium]|jgi:hypothetical protein|nr:T9SS type A sorting domain-containing protein [Tannerellaceae bacterium]
MNIKNYRIAILFGVLLFTPDNMYGQISEGGLPPSFRYGRSLRSTIPLAQAPVTFNVEDMKLVDEWQVSQGQPLKVATLIESGLTIDNAGAWSVLPGGESVWQLNIRAKGAIALMLYYKAFHIPEGGKLFIYNAEKTQVIGAFTHRSNPATDKFATEFIAGDDIVLEYVAAPGGEKPRIEIESIGYGYNHLTAGNNPSLRSETSSCFININCEEGDEWQTEKTGVCKMIQRIGREAYLCSGSLVNNTGEDFKPYILSAYHCSATLEAEASASDYNQWMFYFHYEKSGCDDDSPAILSQTMTGCRKVVSIPLDGGSDGLLLLLNQDIPDSYYAYYNGWDRREAAAVSGVGIHHPEGDYKKISTFTGRATSASWMDEDDNKGADNAHWNVIFAETANGVSVTAGGSSGSPLFNQDKLIAGTLSGGSSDCDNLKGLNLYGKLSYHWDKYSDKPEERMDIWLDPAGTNRDTLRGRYKKEPVIIEKPSALQLTYTNNQVLLTWKKPATQTPERYNVYKDSELLGNTTALSYTDNPSQTGSVVYSVSAVYPNGVESGVVSKTLFISEYLAPSNPKAIFDPASGVVVTWDAPLYRQVIYWGTGSTAYAVGFGGIPFYFGQRWEKDEIAPFHNKLLRAVQFAPAKGVTYSLLIAQGDRKYTQPLTNLVYNKLNVAALETPFTIDDSKSLVVAIHASDYGEDVYPAWCDNGPAEMGKGNILSDNGDVWEHIEEEEFDFNFFLAAVVTSEEGTNPVKSLPATDATLKRSNRKMSVQPVPANNLQLRSSVPAAFPKVTGYSVYRDSRKVNAAPIASTHYVDATAGSGTHKYAVSALYDGWESVQASIQGDVTVGVEQRIESSPTVTPTLFDNYIALLNATAVRKLEIISIDGKLMKTEDNPGDTVYTDTLPRGMYLFRLTTDKEVKIIRGIKR